jgi:hypothetical protein
MVRRVWSLDLQSYPIRTHVNEKETISQDAYYAPRANGGVELSGPYPELPQLCSHSCCRPTCGLAAWYLPSLTLVPLTFIFTPLRRPEVQKPVPPLSRPLSFSTQKNVSYGF